MARQWVQETFGFLLLLYLPPVASSPRGSSGANTADRPCPTAPSQLPLFTLSAPHRAELGTMPALLSIVAPGIE